jgi:hypothetical protein
MGYEASEPHTNHIFLELGRTAAQFRDACRALGVEVGRDFPPMEKTHSRISLGTIGRDAKGHGRLPQSPDGKAVVISEPTCVGVEADL